MRKKVLENKKLRIAVIGAKGLPSHISGLEIYVQNLSVDMANDFDITVFCRKRYCDAVIHEFKGVKVIHVPSINTKHLDAFTYTIFATILALVKGYDVFWYQALGPAVAMPIVKIFKKHIISTVHGLDWKRAKFGKFASNVLKYGEKCIAKDAEKIITLQKYDRNYFREIWGRETLVIPNGVKEPVYKKAKEITQKFGLHKNEYILFMSRIVPEKGLHTLIKAYLEADIDKKLVVAGQGVHTSDYDKNIRKLASGDKNIIFTGLVDGDLKEELYSNACAYVLPSTIEGQSIGLLEAMSYGLTCIVSDIPENVDVVRESGIVFETENYKSLALALIHATQNEGVCADYGVRSQKRIKDYYSWNNTLLQTRKVFEGYRFEKE